MRWESIAHNEKNDWINQRDGLFDTLLPLAPEKKFDAEANSVFETYSMGLDTSRDVWVSNSSYEELLCNIDRAIQFYNSEVKRYQNTVQNTIGAIKLTDFLNLDPTKVLMG